jgi:hypothetical protein
MDLVIAGLTGLGVLIVFGLIVMSQQNKIDKLEEKKVDKAIFDLAVERFSRVDSAVIELKAIASLHTTSLALIQQQVAFLADKNGFKKKEE